MHDKTTPSHVMIYTPNMDPKVKQKKLMNKEEGKKTVRQGARESSPQESPPVRTPDDVSREGPLKDLQDCLAQREAFPSAAGENPSSGT